MQIDVLRYFTIVCESGSMVRAARQVNISQQGLSKAIQNLEKELGVELLTRSRGDGSVPTKAGREFYQGAKDIIERWDDLRTRVGGPRFEGAPDASQDHVTVLATTYVMNNLPSFFHGAPVYGGLSVEKGTLSLFETDYIDIGSTLLDSPKNTVAIVNTCPALLGTMPESPDLEFEAILESDILISCAKGYFANAKKMLTRDDLAGVPFVLHSDRVLAAIMRDYLRDDFNLVSKASDFEKIEAMVSSGEAVTITDTLKESNHTAASRASSVQEFECLPVADPPKTVIGFVRPHNSKQDPICARYEEGCIQRAHALYKAFTTAGVKAF